MWKHEECPAAVKFVVITPLIKTLMDIRLVIPNRFIRQQFFNSFLLRIMKLKILDVIRKSKVDNGFTDTPK